MITGRNSGGKSSLLEALFWNSAGGNPNIPLIINAMRGENVISNDSDRQFRVLFRDMDPKKSIRISADVTKTKRKTQRTLIVDGLQRQNISRSGVPDQNFLGTLRIRFSTKDGDVESRVMIQPLVLNPNIPGATTKEIPFKIEGGNAQHSLLFSRLVSPYTQDSAAEVYSQVVNATKNRSIDGIVDALQTVERRLKAIIPLSEGGQNFLFADVGNKDLMPLPILGSGFFHILRIVLSLFETQNGIVLIDEIENGIHYSILHKIMYIIIKYSIEFDQQIFITTHSSELIEAAATAAEQAAFQDMCVINIGPNSEQKTAHRYYDLPDIRSAIEVRAELR